MEPPRGTTPVPNTQGITKNLACIVKFPLAVLADGLTTEDGKQVYAFLLILLFTALLWKIDPNLGRAVILLILFYIVLRNGETVSKVIDRLFAPFVPEE
jgi:hypothetical protein